MVALVGLIINIFWILDVCNIPFMEMFDTTYPLNKLFWFLMFIFIDISWTEIIIKVLGKTVKSEDKKE